MSRRRLKGVAAVAGETQIGQLHVAGREAVHVASGTPAAGMVVKRVALEAGCERLLTCGVLGTNGALDGANARGQVLVAAGSHEARFFVGDWLRGRKPIKDVHTRTLRYRHAPGRSLKGVEASDGLAFC